MEIELVKPDALKPWPGNPRRMTDEALGRLAKLLDAHGIVAPIIARREDKLVIGGHQRLKANDLRSKPAETVPVIFLDGISDSKAKALNIALNNQEAQGEYDPSKLADALQEIDTGEFSVPDFTAFSEGDIAGLMHGLDEHEVVEDEAPGLQDDAVSRTGDLWLLGEHRLLCGDSTKTSDVSLVASGPVRAVCCDPPYGQNQRGIPGDAPEQHVALVQAAIAAMPLENGVCVAFQSPRTFPAWLDALRGAGHVFERLLWLYKEAQCTYPWRGWLLTSEAILVSSVGEPDWQDAHPYAHDTYRLPAVQGELAQDEGWHGSEKPLAVVLDIVGRIAGEGRAVFDGFLGSGTTVIACEQLGRKCYAIEISPQYVDVAVRRWQNFTEKAATLEGDGRAFAEIEAERT